MTHETAAALNELSRLIFDTEQKLDNYFKQLHDSNAQKITLMASAADDQTAAKCKELYPDFEDLIGTEIAAGTRLNYNGNLYKVRPGKGHVAQADWTPDVATSMFVIINVEHAGTIDDPIPAVAGMEYEYGKYYIEDETIYICQRTGEVAGGRITLYYLPSQLVGQYFEVV